VRRGHNGARCSAWWGEVEGAGSRAGGAGVEDEFAGGSAGPIKGGPGILGGRAPEGRPARNPAGFCCASGENGRKVTGPTGGVTASVEQSG